MKLGGSLIGAILGSLVAAAGWFWWETTGPREAPWAPVVVGVLAGIGARLFSKPSTCQITRGALTAAVALGAMVGTTYGIKQRVESAAVSNTKPAPVRNFEEDVTEEEEEEAEAPPPVDPVVVPSSSSTTPPGSFTNRNMGGQDPIKIAAFYALGSLFAYFVGKGKPVSTACASTASDQTPPENLAE